MTEVTPGPAGMATVDRFDVVTVEAQNRVRLKGVQLRPHLDWLAKETVSCISQRGWLDGLVFWAESYIEDAARAEVQPEKGLAFTYFSTAPSDAPYALTREETSLTYEPSRDRYSLSLPVNARRMRWVPSAGETAVVLVVHNSLQVWWPEAFDLYSQLRPEEIEKRRQARLDRLTSAPVRRP